jgi:anaerobic selenocysteine-containing dehydrogenase
MITTQSDFSVAVRDSEKRRSLLGVKSVQIMKSTCRACHGVCGVLVHVKDGVVTRITGDPGCPLSNGYICAKGRASVELLYHPDRLKFPMKRAGARGENRWDRISWDEALDTVAGRLLKIREEFGPESIVGITGTGRPLIPMFGRFFNSLGTPNTLSIAHICYLPRIMASLWTSGDFPVCDYYGFGDAYPQCVLVWGCNFTESGASDGMCGYQLTQALRRGAKSIVVDPRKTRIASKADLWLQIRPGTDDFLALGMLHTIIKEGLYDRDFVSRWTVGFDDLAKRVEEYPPEKVASITWVPSDAIRAAARTYAEAKPACIQWGVAIDQNINAFQTARAVHLLSAVTGNIDVPGGDVFWVPPADLVSQNPGKSPIPLRQKLSKEMRAKKIGRDQYPVLGIQMHPSLFLKALISGRPYPLKALFITGSNMLLTQSNSLKMAEALRDKPEFTVGVDLFMTPTLALADIVLPAASWLETDAVADMHFTWAVTIRQKVATIGECRDDNEIFIELAQHMGMEDAFPWKNVKEYCDWLLKDTGVTFDQFRDLGILKGDMRYRKYEDKGFATPSGKVELRCSALESRAHDPLPNAVEPPESPYSTPELFKEYPLIITTGGRTQGFFHSEGRQIRYLRKLNPDPIVEIHPATAKELGIENGDWVWIESPRGRIKQRARLFTGIRPGVVHAQHGWWFPEKEPPEFGFTESNVNILTGGMPYDPLCGSESLRSFLCKAYKVRP